MKVYFAGPWFTKAQEEREERLKAKLRDLGFDVFSPKESSNITGSISTKADRKSAFEQNLINIDDADVIFAVCDGKQCKVTEEDQLDRLYNAIDSGTMIECGYAYALKSKGKDLTIVYYSETLGDKPFNLMLAESADIVITNFDDLQNLVEMIKDNRKLEYNGIIE